MTDLFVASNLPTNFPRKLQKPSTVNPTTRESAETFIMDSGIGDDVSNQEVLDLAHDYDADYVVAKDYLHDQERTTESVKIFLQEYQNHPCGATPMIPLQPPHGEHYPDLAGFSYYVLGGMATDDVTNDEILRWIHDAADVIPQNAHVHALGVGGGRETAQALAGKGLVDSIDCSTPEQAAMYGKVLDADLRQREVRIGSGDGARQRNLPLAAFNSWQIQDYWREQARDDAQTTAAEWVDV